MDREKERYFRLIVASVATLLAFIATTFQIYQTSTREALEFGLLESRDAIQDLQFELDAAIDARLEALSDLPEPSAINQEILSLQNRINQVSDQTLGLRQAINPEDPEEILTIARLTDEFKILKNDIDSIEGALQSQQRVFQESVRREIDASSSSTTLILVVLLPLVLNFLYTVWKDFRKERSSDGAT